MSVIHEVATVTSKGQITLPKPIRQALSIDFGSKVAFDLRGSKVIFSRVEDAPHEDPAIASFLSLLEKDIERGKHIASLPQDLVKSMLAALKRPVDLTAEIEGNVAL
ncbi:MAG: type II toxin-antitoxin system PrlF family antitoxin [Burkholderiales bacterium]|nr:type II toxin-antitoxin system PrlF family antitoxin [Burkholderiales bacterium]